MDGKGIYCSHLDRGFWFENDEAHRYVINGYEIVRFIILDGYAELRTHSIRIRKVPREKCNGTDCKYDFLDRKTLKLNSTPTPCQLVHSANALEKLLQDKIDAAKAENKI